MRVVLQRSKAAKVVVADQIIGQIDSGLVLLAWCHSWGIPSMMPPIWPIRL